MKDKIKITQIRDNFQTLGNNDIKEHMKINDLLLKYSKALKIIKDDGDVIYDNIINNYSDLTERPILESYYSNNKQKEKSSTDKIEIITKSDDQINSVIKLLKTASKYVKNNKDKYEFVGDITIKSKTALNDVCSRMNLYLYKGDLLE